MHCGRKTFCTITMIYCKLYQQLYMNDANPLLLIYEHSHGLCLYFLLMGILEITTDRYKKLNIYDSICINQIIPLSISLEIISSKSGVKRDREYTDLTSSLYNGDDT